MTLRLLEHYVSPQGEGPRTGIMTQFVRFAGCNYRCPGWPCDTQHAIEPSLYRDKYEGIDATALVKRIVEMRNTTGAANICLTGGEPFIQPAVDLDQLQFEARYVGMSIEVFTNGSKRIPVFARSWQINMDWKLFGSGEGQRDHEMRLYNAQHMWPSDMIKFVIADEADFHEALAVTELLRSKGVSAQLWAGVAFKQLTEAQLVELMIKHAVSWRLNVQVHKYIWAPEERMR